MIINTNKFLEHQKKYSIRVIQYIKNYIILISSHGDMIDSKQGLIDSFVKGYQKIVNWNSSTWYDLSWP